MEKRVVFRSAWLPYALVAPQIAITVVFFFWPATQAVWYSFQLQDAFGLKTQFVGLQNFVTLFKDSNYLGSFRVTAVFSVLVAFSGIAISLLLATMADESQVRGLKRVGWEEVGPQVHLPMWEKLMQQEGTRLSGVTTCSLPQRARSLDELAQALPVRDEQAPSPEEMGDEGPQASAVIPLDGRQPVEEGNAEC